MLTRETTATHLSSRLILFRAATNCDLFVLSKTDLDIAVSYYPHIAEQIKKVAGNRNDLVRERSQIAAKAAAGECASDAARATFQESGETETGQGKDLFNTMDACT